MIKLENTEVMGWEAAIRGMRNPMNSWQKSDTAFFVDGEYHDILGNSGPADDDLEMIIGPDDHDLMMRLGAGGPVHAKYRRMITVYVDITAPLYWWKEFDTYKVGTASNSCSTMHKIHAKEFTMDDFSCEHLGVLVPAELNGGEEIYQNLWVRSLERTIEDLNIARSYFNRETNPELKKKYWLQMIQLLPTSYNQRRTVMMNYEVLAGIYPMRKNHKLDEWHDFCDWIKSLPYSELIIGEEKED